MKGWIHAGAEPDSAAEGVDTAVGEATQFAKTGSTTKTQSKSDSPKVSVVASSWERVGCRWHLMLPTLFMLVSLHTRLPFFLFRCLLQADCAKRVVPSLSCNACRCQMHHHQRTAEGMVQAKTRRITDWLRCAVSVCVLCCVVIVQTNIVLIVSS